MDDRPFNDNSYEQFLKEEKIMGAKCTKCGAIAVPPRPLCVKCHSRELEWVQLKGEGKLAAFTSIVVAPPNMAKEGYGRNNPYIVGVVELAEGNKIVSRIGGLDAKNPEGIKLGSPLKAEFLHSIPGEEPKTTLVFRS
jgi:uncharacterized protein